MNIKLAGLFTLRSPLSHIGESISTTSYLVQEPVLQLDGTVEEVFCYSGNAWRGQLRDLAAIYMLEHLGAPRVSLDVFHLLFSGGRIGGDQVIDINQARIYRRTVPMLALWGGGVGNQILPGKIRVGNCYPLCREAIPVLPSCHHEEADAVEYRELTFEKSFSRKDDAKDDRLSAFLPEPLQAKRLLEVTREPQSESKGDFDLKPEGKREEKKLADQMRMTCELLIAGAKLHTEIVALDVTEVELGALVSAIHAFSRSPHIGGQANKGHGLVTLVYDYLDLDAGKQGAFLTVGDGPSLLAPPAAEAKEAYDQYLRISYDAMLQERGGEIRQLLGATS